MGLTLGTLGSFTSSGWATPTPTAGATIWYVDPTGGIGSDSNNGLSPSFPFATLAKARTSVVSGRGDWVALRKATTTTGDTAGEGLFGNNGFINKTGLGPQDLLLYTNYTTNGFVDVATTPRGNVSSNEANPIISYTASGNHAAIGQNNDNACDYLGIIGLDFIPSATPGLPAIRTTNANLKIFIEDCGFVGGSVDLEWTGGDMTVRRSVITSNPNSMGLLWHRVSGALLEEVFLNHNGWTDATAGDRQTFYHNVYGNFRIVLGSVTEEVDTTVAETWAYNCNVSAYASDAALRMRQRGIAYDNLCVAFGQGIEFGSNNAVNGVTANARTISDNVFLDGYSGNGAIYCVVGTTPTLVSVRRNLVANKNSSAAGDGTGGIVIFGGPNADGTNGGVDVDASNQVLNWGSGAVAYLPASGNTVVTPITDTTGKDYTNMSLSAYATYLNTQDSTRYPFTTEAGLLTAMQGMRRYNYDSNFHANTINNWMRAKANMAAINLGAATFIRLGALGFRLHA